MDGAFDLAKPQGQLCWVTWRELSTAPRGTVGTDGVISWGEPRGGFTQYAELTEFCRRNLATFWAGVVDQWQAALDSGSLSDNQVDTDSVIWTVLGPARLITTIEIGDAVSKTASGQLAAQRWPEHSDLIERAIGGRAGAQVAFNLDDARAVVALGRCIVEAGQTAVCTRDRSARSTDSPGRRQG